MITLAHILAIIGLMAALMGFNAHLNRPRFYRNYSREVIVHKMDSLMAEKLDRIENAN